MALADAIKTALATAEQLKHAGVANEANTRALVIEPVIAALGWNLGDFAEVDREHKVFDGTFRDYALQIEGVPRLFVEAKALGKSLADKQFIAQTVNYANNEGVVWCVLTNGLVYQVYKSNEPVPMDRKLLFEVDLAENDGPTHVALNALSRSSVQSGQLEAWGDAVFTDIRVRAALSRLAAQPTGTFLTAVAEAIEGPAIEQDRLRGSLVRLIGSSSGPTSAGPLVGTPPSQDLVSPPKSKLGATTMTVAKTNWTVEHHLNGKPSLIVDLFEKVDTYATGLGPDVLRRPTKLYIGYFAGKKSFFTIELQKAKAWIYLSLPPADAQPWLDAVMRDVTDIGHFGMGDTEFQLTSPDQLADLKTLLSQSYLRNRK